MTLSEILEEACKPEPPVILMSDLTHLDGTPLTDEEQAQLKEDFDDMVVTSRIGGGVDKSCLHDYTSEELIEYEGR